MGEEREGGAGEGCRGTREATAGVGLPAELRTLADMCSRESASQEDVGRSLYADGEAHAYREAAARIERAERMRRNDATASQPYDPDDMVTDIETARRRMKGAEVVAKSAVEQQEELALARITELEKLAYIGEHRFPDQTWKARCEELVRDRDRSEARPNEREMWQRFARACPGCGLDLTEHIEFCSPKAKPAQCTACECRPATLCRECYRDDNSPLIDDERRVRCNACHAVMVIERDRSKAPVSQPFAVDDYVRGWCREPNGSLRIGRVIEAGNGPTVHVDWWTGPDARTVTWFPKGSLVLIDAPNRGGPDAPEGGA